MIQSSISAANERFHRPLHHRPRQAASRLGVAVIGRAFSRRHAPLSSAPRRTWRWSTPTAMSAGRRPWRRHPVARRPMASASSPAATTARSSSLDAKGEAQCWRPTPRGAGSTMSRCIPTARWRGRPARRPSSAARKGEEKSRSRCPRPSAAWRSRRRAAARGRPLQRRDAVVSEHGRRTPNCWNGRARISACDLQPGQQVPGHRRCTKRRCTAGGSPTAGTCG